MSFGVSSCPLHWTTAVLPEVARKAVNGVNPALSFDGKDVRVMKVFEFDS